MKIDLSGFSPGRTMNSGIASNLNTEEALKKSSEGYIKQIKDENNVIGKNLEKLSTLDNLRKIISDFSNTIRFEILTSLSQKNAIIDKHGYLTADVDYNGQIMDFVISDLKIATPQVLKAKGFDREVSLTGKINIVPISCIKKQDDSVILTDNPYLNEVTINCPGNELHLEKFTPTSPQEISVKINNEDFTSEFLPEFISDQIKFHSSQEKVLTINIREGFF